MLCVLIHQFYSNYFIQKKKEKLLLILLIRFIFYFQRYIIFLAKRVLVDSTHSIFVKSTYRRSKEKGAIWQMEFNRPGPNGPLQLIIWPHRRYCRP